MKTTCFLALLFLSHAVFGGGWTNLAEVNSVEIIRGQGFQINGDFGNPSGCTASDAVFVQLSHPQYQELLSTALTVFSSGTKLLIYSHQCIDYGWHAGTYNELTGSGSMKISK